LLAQALIAHVGEGVGWEEGKERERAGRGRAERKNGVG
jgi:hypothetical protein